MNDPDSQAPPAKLGRPKRGTESARADTLIGAAIRVFLRDGYESTSIDKVAGEAGVSTRTIYERFKNKADLLGAAIARLVERDMATVIAPAELERLPLRSALTLIGKTLTGRARNPDSAALIRILAKEAQRFPELAARMRGGTKLRVDNALATFFRTQVARGHLALADPDRAAVLFLQMVFAELQECLLFGSPDDMAAVDFDAHLNAVIDLFLYGALPRSHLQDDAPE
jgi:TetR/AcrR family transcriptional repressor of mexJK operon